MRNMFLPFAKPSLGEEEISGVVDSLRSGWITTGPKTEKFTEAFREYASALSSATAGLHLAVLAHGVGPGDEVITTPMTFAATLNVVELVGATPVLADIDRRNLNIRGEEIEKKITARTKAVIPVTTSASRATSTRSSTSRENIVSP